MSTPNYVVYYSTFRRLEEIMCETKKEVWEAISNRPFGGPYTVVSPTGLPVQEFEEY